MIIKNVNALKPAGGMVLVKIVNAEDIIEEILSTKLSTEDSIAQIHAEVISMGPEVNTPEYCEGLEVGKFITCSQFAGSHIATDTKEMYKLVSGTDIVGIYNNMKSINSYDVIPAGRRVLIEQFDASEGEEVITGSTGSDPRLADMNFGVITGVGKSVENKNLAKGLIVGYPPYAGTGIREQLSKEEKALVMIHELDVLVTTDDK